AAGMSKLTIAGVIATTATIIPTPLGGDNVAIAEELASYPMFEGLTVTEYVFSYHAAVSIPVILLMAIVHYFWQRYRDSKDETTGDSEDFALDDEAEKSKTFKGSTGYRVIYALLPILPI